MPGKAAGDGVDRPVRLLAACAPRRVEERRGLNPTGWPLSYYQDKSFYTMRTAALDRFGTALEQRFSRAQIEAMMRTAGLEDIIFSEAPPYWCAVGYRPLS